jgi:hypothetical protein
MQSCRPLPGYAAIIDPASHMQEAAVDSRNANHEHRVPGTSSMPDVALLQQTRPCGSPVQRSFPRSRAATPGAHIDRRALDAGTAEAPGAGLSQRSDQMLTGRTELTPAPRSNSSAPIATSDVLQRLSEDAPADQFTLGWLMSSLQRRSFGIIMLLLALLAIAPGISMLAGLLLMFPALQMIAGRPGPVFPRSIAARGLPTRSLAVLVQRAVPVLRYLETMIHPRWPIPLGATRHLVGIVVLMLNAIVVFAPIPLSNVIPALIIALISLAYLEEDGLLLSIALLAAVAVLTGTSIALWQMVLGAQWISSLW